MTDTTNINGHRQQIAAQLASVVAFVGQDNFLQIIPDPWARGHYWSRIDLLERLLQTIDDTLADPNSVPQEVV
jgi:hypothetical protein